MTVKNAVLCWLLILESTLCLAADSSQKWEVSRSWSSYVEFLKANETRIVSLTNLDLILNKGEVLGLKVSESPLADWSAVGNVLTNVVCLRITTSAVDLSSAFFSAITNYPKLQYLHLECRQTVAIPPDISSLTNLVHLRYLGIDGPSATNIDRRIYRITTLKELFLVVGSVSLPDGITHLANLTRLEIHGRRANPVRSLPADLLKCMVQRLVLANVLGVERLLPALPPNLVELNVLNCQMHAVPNGWFSDRKLQILDLTHNELNRFPEGLLAIRSLKFLGLDLNNIAVVPALKIPKDRNLTISLISNPIRHFSSQNDILVSRGVIEK
jgi:Leucine-rich repeat (LRR) protein